VLVSYAIMAMSGLHLALGLAHHIAVSSTQHHTSPSVSINLWTGLASFTLYGATDVCDNGGHCVSQAM
jgi:hypothetical protein